MNNTFRPRIADLTQRLIAVPSVSPDARSETACAHTIVDILHEMGLEPQLLPTGDGRASVACLLKGTAASLPHAKPTRTLILMGHYDTVGVSEFARLDAELGRAIAFDSERLRQLFLSASGVPATIKEAAAAHDAEGPLWLFGRGSADMKSGIAINLALLEHLAREVDQLAGNVLFLACPDEENASIGVRSAVPHLQLLAHERALDFAGLINTDYSTIVSPSDDGRNVYAGTIGKLLVGAYITGVPAHVGDPYRGIDANILLAELVRAFHLNPSLADEAAGDLGSEKRQHAVPPVVLKASDLKARYNVQTAAEAFLNLNCLTLEATPGVVIERLKHEASAVLESIVAQHRQRAAEAGFDFDIEATGVLTYAELLERVAASRGQTASSANFRAFVDGVRARLAAKSAGDAKEMEGITGGATVGGTVGSKHGAPGDVRGEALQLVRELVRLSGVPAPCVVLFLAPPYYPHVRPDDSALLDAVRSSVQQPRFEGVALRGCFPFISDLSYIARPDAAQIVEWQAQAPIADEAAFSGLDGVPVINLGPWGFDAHGLYERVFTPYSFETVPQLILNVVRRLLG